MQTNELTTHLKNKVAYKLFAYRSYIYVWRGLGIIWLNDPQAIKSNNLM